MKFSTILLLFLCTPFLPLIYSKTTEPDVVRLGTTYLRENGQNYRCETYLYYGKSQKARIEFWVKDTINNLVFVEDSIWIYFDSNGDTLKKIIYKKGKIIKEIKHKKQP